jgi:glycosyltransferase involved in cell wall biosynthesis
MIVQGIPVYKSERDKDVKILIISQYFPPEPTGGAIHNYEMAKYLSLHGFNITVITTQPTFPYGEFRNKIADENSYPFTLKRIWAYQPESSDPSKIKRVFHYVSFTCNSFLHSIYKNRYHLVITSQPPDFTLIPGFLLKNLRRNIWMVDVRDLWLENAASLGFIKENGVIFKIFKKFRSYCFKSIDIFAYTAPTIKKWFYYQDSIKAVSIFNPNGINPAEYPLKTKIGNNLLFVGNIGYAYNLKLIIESLSILKKYNLKLLIVGGGDLKKELQQFVLGQGLDDNVIYIDKLPHHEVLNIISNCRIGLCPLKEIESLKSSIPIKALEYMGCGIPFIGTGIGEIEKLAEESGGGIIVNSNPKSMAKAIHDLYFDEQECQEMGEKGRIYVEKRFNKVLVMDHLSEVIGQCIKK